MGLLKNLMQPTVDVNGQGRAAWDDRKGTYDQTNEVLEAFSLANGAEFIAAPEFRGERFFGMVSGARDSVRYDMRGWMDMTQSGGAAGLSRSTSMAFFIEVRATLPGPTSVRKLKRRADHGPFTPERFAKVFAGDLASIAPDARTELLKTAARTSVCVLEQDVLLVSSRDPVLCPPAVDADGLDWLVARATRCARALSDA